ncbi:N-glycosylase/DNA lyase isoform X2 [Neocloeon triangulifer]|uniref:N-glycosylase/DNA lyase isoform X2 n=1 Tax=Neocloeon triangulifer TaxID=2078957 RepID=UPI00286EC5E3|nr:N-glycosylase/DNA lyase isoform X2 [Neocloeon triangulifer]
MWMKTVCRKTDLNLKLVLNGGQCFRWKETEPGTWTGVIEDLVWQIRWGPSGDDQLEFKVHGVKGPELDEFHLSKRLIQYLRLDTPLQPLYEMWSRNDENFKKIVGDKNFAGVRILKQHPRENVFSFICSSNNNISRISSMVENLCKLYGNKICQLDEKDYFSFPTVERLAEPGVESQLRANSFGYRAPFIQKAARKIVENGGDQWLHGLSKVDYPQAKESLITLPGIGAKVADCICLMSMGHMQAVPVDTHVFQIAANWYLPHLKKNKTVTNKIYEEISGHFQELYGPKAGWAHTVLFCADLKMFQHSSTSIKKSPKKREAQTPKKISKRAKSKQI